MSDGAISLEAKIQRKAQKAAQDAIEAMQTASRFPTADLMGRAIAMNAVADTWREALSLTRNHHSEA